MYKPCLLLTVVLPVLISCSKEPNQADLVGIELSNAANKSWQEVLMLKCEDWADEEDINNRDRSTWISHCIANSSNQQVEQATRSWHQVLMRMCPIWAEEEGVRPENLQQWLNQCEANDTDYALL